MEREELESLAVYMDIPVEQLLSLIENLKRVQRHNEVLQRLREMAKELETAVKRLKRQEPEFVYGLAELKLDQRERGRSKPAQYGKTHTARQCTIPRPDRHRIRSFCVRAALIKNRKTNRNKKNR